jgi:hypothetical protein
MTQAPTSLTLSLDSELNVDLTTIAAAVLDIAGFQVRWAGLANGYSYLFEHYVTVGN